MGIGFRQGLGVLGGGVRGVGFRVWVLGKEFTSGLRGSGIRRLGFRYFWVLVNESTLSYYNEEPMFLTIDP